MGTHILNNYIFKALDAYPYELEKATEAINYALSYNEKDTMALCLKGRIYAETLKDYDKAKNDLFLYIFLDKMVLIVYYQH